MNYRNSRNYDNLERRIFDGVEKIISGWNIPTDVIPNRCTPLPGIGRTVRNTPFGWYMVPVMSLISTMSGFGGMC